MQTDIPLKRLTALRAHDLLPLLASEEATVVAVETLELPASATRLDNVLRLRSVGGQEYLHVIEWQGYTDPAVLWRLAGYLAWLGQRHHEQVVVGTVIYLTPASDVGDTLRQTVDGRDLLAWPVPAIRLWELDALEASQRGSLGLAVLSPCRVRPSRWLSRWSLRCSRRRRSRSRRICSRSLASFPNR